MEVTLVAGVDEAGRGPLAGPVFAAAVILDPNKRIIGLADSKLLSPKKREALFGEIQNRAVAWAVGRAEVEEIDLVNIFQATFLAMQRAVAELSISPQQVLIDGKFSPQLPCPAKAIIGGDQKISCISAASIVAKVLRDRKMCELDKQYPEYGFARHKGYGTEEHLAAIRKYGITPVHRRSFAPVKEYIK